MAHATRTSLTGVLSALLAVLLLATIAPPSAADNATNLLSTDQQDVESSTDGWTEQGNTTLTRTTPGSTGSHALAVHVDRDGKWADNTRTARAGTTPGKQGIPVDVGTTYYGSIDTRPADGTSPTDVRCELRWFNSRGRIISTVTNATMTTQQAGQWVTTTCEGTAPNGTTHASLRVFANDTGYGDTHLVDNAWFTDAPITTCLLYTSPSPRDRSLSRMPSSA